jgi:UDP-galactopyranose mutase
MFRDKWQGWCDDGWQSLTHDLLANAGLRLGVKVTHQNLPSADAYVITAPLDEFLGEPSLPWRGVRLVTDYSPAPARGFSMRAPVVNTPSVNEPYTRVIEFDQFHSKPKLGATGTLLCHEYPGAAARHYPVDDVAGENRAQHRELAGKLKAELPNAVLAGRLANYVYIDIDQAVVQGIHAARRVIKEEWRDR